MIYLLAEFLQRSFQYATTKVRQEAGSGPAGLLIVILQSLSMVLVFGIIMWLFQSFRVGVRGNFALNVLVGVGFFLVHNKIVGAMASSSSGDASLRKFGVSPTMAIVSSFSANFFLQMAAIFIILMGIYAYYGGFVIDDFNSLIQDFLILIIWSVVVGVVFMSINPLLGPASKVVSMLYMRLGMVTSGKFLLGNSTPAALFDLYSWNPLFHLIDQARGSVFLNYNPFKTSLTYPITMIFIVGAIAMFLEFLGRRKFGVTAAG